MSDFRDVLQISKVTLEACLLEYPIHSYNKDVLVDTDNCYRVIVEWKNCLGEMLVEQANYAPYRYLTFNILPTDIDEVIPIFAWNDSDTDSLESIKDKIKEGVCCAFDYNQE